MNGNNDEETCDATRFDTQDFLVFPPKRWRQRVDKEREYALLKDAQLRDAEKLVKDAE